MLQSITVSEFDELKAVQESLSDMEEKIQNIGVSLDIVHGLQDNFDSRLEENDIKEIYELLVEHGTKTVATYAISNNMGYEIVYTDEDNAIIKEDEELFLCEVKGFSETVEELEIDEDDREDMNEDTFYIIYENSYIPLDECMRTN